MTMMVNKIMKFCMKFSVLDACVPKWIPVKEKPANKFSLHFSRENEGLIRSYTSRRLKLNILYYYSL